MKLTDSQQALLDEMLKDEKQEEISEGWKNYLEVYDGDFDALKQEIDDGLGSILANAALVLSEQRKLFQGAKSPSALAEALKFVAATSGNLVNAGLGMLSFLGSAFRRK